MNPVRFGLLFLSFFLTVGCSKVDPLVELLFSSDPSFRPTPEPEVLIDSPLLQLSPAGTAGYVAIGSSYQGLLEVTADVSSHTVKSASGHVLNFEVLNSHDLDPNDYSTGNFE